ncbi:alpha/beta fold hydrolase [Microbacterium azadirachtae]|uniref:4,5:9,10-diseco-3-hydroxy-5,9, 17-trioxoandrosta-1(10),2-diene-4-oate hydrolase n=1 Tax=Microbacterium azadirachtae TaxID=582680 RepID=A0A0F0LEY6_9MICO|nr:alpha/beta hydrolase [Microbacterium azadirachtae]KJL31772.1 4,5:9,10-diseco-3-hydroxy-5,9,17-trioxoandrosta-1(10),2-diene-4-oate hydrolase [Microbacterium azadirachtae]
MRSRATTALIAGVLLAAVVSGCAPQTRLPPGNTHAPLVSTMKDRAGMVSLSSSRDMYLTCRGSGSPTVVLMSGTGGAADEWTTLPPPSSPPATRASATAVLPALASDARVCAYDRPGTTREDGDLSPTTPVPQPTTALHGVRDLRDLLDAAGERGPVLLVGASWGGMIAQLYARTYPRQVVGLVLVDSASTWLAQTLSADQWQAWMAAIAAAGTDSTAERPAYEPSLQEFAAARPAPDLPTTVLSSDQPWDLGVTPGASTWPAWLAAQDELARASHATHLSATHSGHGIQVEQPDLVASAIRDVLAEARGK